MRGAVAAGHPLTAQAGARALEEGGNAVDACVAAAFAGAVCESFLTSPAAGGFMLVHRARDRSTRLADFFVSAPGLGLKRPRAGEMEAIDVGFGDSETTQPFLIGPATVAVPGAVAGLEAVHRAYGRLPWNELLVPAIELARGGIELSRPQAHIHGLLDPIIRFSRRGPSRLQLADRCPARRRRHAAPSRPRRHVRGDRGSRRCRRLSGRPRQGDRRHRARRRRRPHARRSRRLPSRLAPSRPGRLPRPRGRLEPAAVLRRRPHRLRARAPPTSSRRAIGKRRGARSAGGRHARAGSRARRQLRPRSPPGRAGHSACSHPHRSARPSAESPAVTQASRSSCPPAARRMSPPSTATGTPPPSRPRQAPVPG